MDSFLRPHVKSRDTQSNLGETNENSTEEPSNELHEDESSSSTSRESREELSQKKTLQPDNPTTSQIKKMRSKTVADRGSPMEKLDEISKKAASNAQQLDCFDHFGNYIASLLRSLSENRSSHLQAEIVALILKPNNEVN
ncbi:unnamed protein product [Tenebrio molitor]|nr:unnamed protein product [Tenebrio molitor]